MSPFTVHILIGIGIILLLFICLMTRVIRGSMRDGNNVGGYLDED